MPTNVQLQQAVAHINNLDPCPDVVLATGDLTDHGTAEEYAALREILGAFGRPCTSSLATMTIATGFWRRSRIRPISPSQGLASPTTSSMTILSDW